MAHATVYDGPTMKVFSITLAGAGAATETIPHGVIENGVARIPEDVKIVPTLAKFYAGTPVLTLVDATNVVVDFGAGWAGDAAVACWVIVHIPHSTAR